jgi:hypothetical protein
MDRAVGKVSAILDVPNVVRRWNCPSQLTTSFQRLYGTPRMREPTPLNQPNRADIKRRCHRPAHLCGQSSRVAEIRPGRGFGPSDIPVLNADCHSAPRHRSALADGGNQCRSSSKPRVSLVFSGSRQTCTPPSVFTGYCWMLPRGIHWFTLAFY